MSILDESQELTQNDAIKELIKALEDFYNEKYLDSTTDLTPELIELLTRVKYKDNIIKEVFGVETHLYDRVVKELEKRYRSKNRMGRTEGIGALSMQFTQIMTKTHALIERALGTGG